MSIPILALIAIALPSLAPQGNQPHDLEIKQLADILALSQVIVDKCPNMLVDATKLAFIRERLHFHKPEDEQPLIDEARAAISSFEDEIAHTSSATVWCDANYNLYGPRGNSIPGLLLRRADQP